MDRHQLKSYQLSKNAFSGDLLLLVSGILNYKQILANAFPKLYFSRTFEDRNGTFDWGTYVKGATDEDEPKISALCVRFGDCVLVLDDLDESFTLSFHTQTSSTGVLERTSIGALVRTAKSYSTKSGDTEKATEVARLLSDFILNQPTYNRADLIVSVPGSNVAKMFDLPTLLSEKICGMSGKPVANKSVVKTRDTKRMKECRTMAEKVDNIKDAFAVDATVFFGKSVIIIDDVYETGLSMNELGRTIKNAGAFYVCGLAATKTTRDVSDDN